MNLPDAVGFGSVFRASFFALLLQFGVVARLDAAAVYEQPRKDPIHVLCRAHKLRLKDRELGKNLVDQGAYLVADYGSFQFYSVSNLTSKLMADTQVEPQDQYNWIHLNSRFLNTATAESQALRKPVDPFAGKHLHLVQFAGPVLPAWREHLFKSGVQFVAYVPQNAYLVYGEYDCLTNVQALAVGAPYIQWEGTYTGDQKIHSAVLASTGFSDGLFSMQMVVDAAANSETLALLERLKLEPFCQQYELRGYLNVVARLAVRDLETVAARPDVLSIQPHGGRVKFCERQAQIAAGNLAGKVPGGPGFLAWLAAAGFTQAQFASSGFSVDVSDSGVDNGTVVPNHFALYPGGNLSLPSRIVYNRLEGTPNVGSTLAGCDGHGTLNAHIIGGYDDLLGFPHTDDSGFHYGLGLCPFVSLGSSVIFDPDQFTYPNYVNLQSRAYRDGARISNNSWGSLDDIYDIDAQTFDVLVRDAQPASAACPAAGNQQMVIVFAAGNGGPMGHTVGSPGTAKNVITVGAAQNVQAFGGSDICGTADSQALNADELYTGSSRGPCNDGRHKPDLVAPGTHVSGGLPEAAKPGTNGTTASCFNGSGICGGVSTLAYPPGQGWFTASSGTSHAAPCVAGACALLRQYFINRSMSPPSPAMTKAFLINSARYLTGASANDTLWSDSQGMGELNLSSAFNAIPRILHDELSGDMFNASGQARVLTGIIFDTNQPFRVTVSWTDAPGSTVGSAYNNDLDLTVIVGTNLFKGNVFNGPYSVPGGLADKMNNTESVFLPPGVGGTFRVTVTAANINSQGVPNQGSPLNQDYALVICNAVASDGPAIVAGDFSLLTAGCVPTNGSVNPGEVVTANLALQNMGWTATSNLMATLQTQNGVTALSGAQFFGALAPGGPATQRPYTFLVKGLCGDFATLTLNLLDGTTSLGQATFRVALGRLVTNTVWTENFDEVTVPALPSGWITTALSGQSPWVTTTSAHDSPPNAAYVPDPGNIGLSDLVTPRIHIDWPTATLTFRNRFDLEAEADVNAPGYDGGVLELRIGDGPWTDLLTAGASFLSGGYNRIISTDYGNPLAGRRAWSGNSGDFVSTTIKLPPGAAGNSVQFRWRCGTDSSNGANGWLIDDLSISQGTPECCVTSADLSLTQSAPTAVNLMGKNLIYNLFITNSGPAVAGEIDITDVLPFGVTLLSASPGATVGSGFVTWNLPALFPGSTTNFVMEVAPVSDGYLTNQVWLRSGTLDTNLENNISLATTLCVVPPQMALHFSESTMSISIKSRNELHYVLEYKNAIYDPEWHQSATVLSGNGDTLTFQVDLDPSPTRFFRIRLY